MTTNKNTNNDKNNIEDNIDYKKLYIRLVSKVKEAVDIINASDYSKKSLGRFKERVERIVYKAENNIKK